MPFLSEISKSGIIAIQFTVQEAVFPLLVITDILAVPALRPMMFPFLSTLTIDGLLDTQVICLFVALDGKTTAFNLFFSPTLMVQVTEEILTEVASIVGFMAFTVHVAVLPLDVLTVMIDVPSFCAKIRPF